MSNRVVVGAGGTAGTGWRSALPAGGAVLGVLVSWYAFHWDIAWHMDMGRDKFLSIPHLLIIFGYGLSGGAGLLGLSVGRVPLRRAWRDRPGLVLVMASAATGLINLTFDNWWHGAFGPDGTVWSPPHLLLAFVSLMAIVGSLVDSRRRGRKDSWVIVASAVLLASLSVLLSEYEYGYPHFRTGWWAPVFGLIAGLVLALARSATRLRWAATAVAALTLGLRVGAQLLNAALERSVPVPPAALLVAAVGVDLLRIGSERGVKGVLKAAAAWVPASIAFEMWYDTLGRVDLPSSARLVTLVLSTATWLGGVALGLVVADRLTMEAGTFGLGANRHRRSWGGTLVLASIIALVFAASALPQFGEAGKRVAAAVEFDGERVVLAVPTAAPGDAVTVIGPKQAGCRPEECVKGAGRRWLGRLEQSPAGMFTGSVNGRGDWIALWYVGGDHVWGDAVARPYSGLLQLEPLAAARVQSPAALVAGGAGLWALIVVYVVMLASAIRYRPSEDRDGLGGPRPLPGTPPALL